MRATVHAETADGDALLGALFVFLNEGREAPDVWTGSADETSVQLQCPLALGALDPEARFRCAFAARTVAEDLERAALDESVPVFGPLTITVDDSQE